MTVPQGSGESSGDQGDSSDRPEPAGDIRIGGSILSGKTGIATVIALVVLGVTAFRVLDIDWDEMWDQVKGVDPVTYLLAMVLYYASFLVRGIRWRLIVRTAQLDRQPGVVLIGTPKFAAIILMGWFANSVAFLRLGDAYRGYALARETGIPMASAVGTLLGERAQDVLLVLGLLVVASAGLLVAGEVTLPIYVLVAAAGASSATLLALVVMRNYGERLAHYLPARFEATYYRLHTGTLGSFKARQLPLQFSLGIIGWGLEIARVYFVAESLGLEIGFFVVMSAALAIAILTTIPTPGGFGFVEGGLTGVLIFLGMGDTQALTLTVVDRTSSWLSIIIIGGTLFLTWQTLAARRANGRRGDNLAAGSAAAPVLEDRE